MKMKYWALFHHSPKYTAAFGVYGKCEISLISQIFASLLLEYIKKKTKHLRGSFATSLKDDRFSQVQSKKWKKKTYKEDKTLSGEPFT